MNVCAFDTETALIRPALHAPPMVCLTWQRPEQTPGIVHWSDARPRIRSWLIDSTTILVSHNAAFDSAVICAEFPDLTPFVFDAYRANRITCTKKRQQLLDIAGGVYRGRPGDKGRWIVHNYDLDSLSRRLLGQPLQKDGWRLSYHYFRDTPLSGWVERAREVQVLSRARRAELDPSNKAHEDEIRNLDAIITDSPEGVLKYPLADAAAHLGVYLAQEKHAEYLQDQYRQSYADFVLHLSSTWGLRTDAAGVEALRVELDEAHRELEEELQGLGLVREGGKQDGVRDMKAVKLAMIAACREYGLPIRRTEAHSKPNKKTGLVCADQVGEGMGEACETHVCLDSDACEAVVLASAADGAASEAGETFFSYAEFTAVTKMLRNDVKMLLGGVEYPVHTHYDLAETGRTTSSAPNIQNLNTGRVKNKKSQAQRLRKGVRQAFVPRPGKVFMQADFPQLELYALAQCCMSWLGYSKLAEALNAGLDPHLMFAAKVVGCSYEEALKNKKSHDVDHARQVGKVFNFGKPGGLGNKKLVLYARKTYGVELTIEQCQHYTEEWHATFPEMRGYFGLAAAKFPEGVERAMTCTLWTERWRGGATYCAVCNNGYQALGVDCAKRALCLVAEAEYVDTASPLYGDRTVAFVHDEIIGETDDDAGAHDAAFELARLMTAGANEFLPDVPIKVERMEPTLMRRWSKDAKQVFDTNDRLVPWDVTI